MILLVWTKIPIAKHYVPKPKQKKEKKELPKEDDLSFTSFIFPGEFFF